MLTKRQEDDIIAKVLREVPTREIAEEYEMHEASLYNNPRIRSVLVNRKEIMACRIFDDYKTMTQRQIAKKYGITTITVREALKRAVGYGMTTHRELREIKHKRQVESGRKTGRAN